MDKPFWICLRSYEVTCAQNSYECKNCRKPIDPGESYIAYVMVSREHKLIVEREHHFCWDDDPFDDWDEDDDLFELEDSSSDSYKESLPMAA